jgi:putative copper resistance protein D
MIALHHTLLGSFGIGAAVSSAMVAWASGISPQAAKRWELVWAGLVIVMGFQLLVYSE